MQKKDKLLKSLTIFFPFFNDAGTVKKAIDDAYEIGALATKDLEVIAIHGGNSSDNTFDKIKKAKHEHPSLRIIDQSQNKLGYAVIKHGLVQAKKEWVFYTDGDLQYNLLDLLRLINKQQQTQADVVNGIKINRGDDSSRTALGELYKMATKSLFKLPISDPTCDFRLMRADLVKKCPLFSRNASICVELIKELQINGASFAEIPVRHRKRRYGKSNYQAILLLIERFFGDLQLWIRLKRRYN